MCGFNSTNDASRYFEKIGSTTIFYASPHDTRNSTKVGKNTLCIMAEISQWCANNVCDFKMHEANF